MFDKATIEKYLAENARRKKRVILFFIFVVLLLLTMFYRFYLNAPKDYPLGSLYHLESGQTLSTLSQNFHDEHIIQSDFWFKSFMYLFSIGNRKTVAGYYLLDKKENVIMMAWRVTHGLFDIIPTKVTIPEGLNSREVADILSINLIGFDKRIFLNLVSDGKLEGYLFPDTYFLFPGMTEAEIIKMMHDDFDSRIKGVQSQIIAFGKSESDVVKMASILEEEARLTETKQIVAGILWKRISLRMPLQVDSSFKYLIGKTSAQLTDKDLKIDSPYNSYTHLGLPPTPISNPGLDSIKAAINPIQTPYLYFLNDRFGNMHYAVTLKEHIANITKYLK